MAQEWNPEIVDKLMKHLKESADLSPEQRDILGDLLDIAAKAIEDDAPIAQTFKKAYEKGAKPPLGKDPGGQAPVAGAAPGGAVPGGNVYSIRRACKGIR